MMESMLVIVGAGGHAKVVIATARSAGWTQLTLVDHASALWGGSVLGIPISGGVDEALADSSAQVVLAIGSNAGRLKLAQAARCRFMTLVHRSAIVDPSVELGPGTVVFAGCVIQPDTKIGAHGIVNTGASIDHDCTLGIGVHVAPGACLAGNVELGDRVFVGIGAALIPGIRVGRDSVVGAGATVVKNVEPGTTVIGTPARKLR